MRALPNEFSNSILDEASSSNTGSLPPATQEPTQEQPVETSLFDLSAVLLVVLAAIVLTFTGAIVALCLPIGGGH